MLIVLLIMLGSSLKLFAQQRKQTFVLRINYLLYLPERYGEDTTIHWPLVLFLHGSGEVGDSVQWVARNGPPKLAAEGKKFPFILVSPQSTTYKWQNDYLISLLKEIKEKYRVDQRRVYLTGMSMGGDGTWALSEEYPDEFAAILPLSGEGDTTQAWKLRYMPIWCFHGLKDNVVPPLNSIDMVKAIKRYNSGVKLTLYPDAGHDTWSVTYSNDKVYRWMLAQKRTARKSLKWSLDSLRSYCGTYVAYVDNTTDTLSLAIKDNKILATRPGEVFPLFPVGKDLFFINENLSVDIRFERDLKGQLAKLVIWSNQMFTYKKLEEKQH